MVDPLDKQEFYWVPLGKWSNEMTRDELMSVIWYLAKEIEQPLTPAQTVVAAMIHTRS